MAPAAAAAAQWSLTVAAGDRSTICWPEPGAIVIETYFLFGISNLEFSISVVVRDKSTSMARDAGPQNGGEKSNIQLSALYITIMAAGMRQSTIDLSTG